MQLLQTDFEGQLDSRDPIHTHLALSVLPRAGIKLKRPDFEIKFLNRRQAVYLYEEKKSQSRFVCKFFGSRRHLTEKECRKLLSHEFRSLIGLRAKGFCGYPLRVVRPLSRSEKMNCLLVEDFVNGHDLDYYIEKAAFEGHKDRLLRKLTMLADFLAKLHTATALSGRINFKNTAREFRDTVRSLRQGGLLNTETTGDLLRSCAAWERTTSMWADHSVLVHGDVTPTNFIFHPETGLTAIDLERMRTADRAYDLGFLAAELKNHFAWRILRSEASEPFINHFFQAYCANFSDPRATFKAVTYRNRFYMALGELRIARNPWLPGRHRSWLCAEALRCLQISE
jgi:aminoglycoside phosphotransferase (APT) family kinase protein